MGVYSLFQKGGPIMWPLLVASVVSLTVVVERLFFVVNEMRKRDSESVEKILSR